jgi:hypothetical protein
MPWIVFLVFSGKSPLLLAVQQKSANDVSASFFFGGLYTRFSISRTKEAIKPSAIS